MEAKYPMITLSELIVEKIKTIYFPDMPWPECYKDVARHFSTLKGILRKFFVDKSDIEILKAISKFTYDDIKDAMETMSNNKNV